VAFLRKSLRIQVEVLHLPNLTFIRTSISECHLG
jgi:hypothetical protein